MIKKITSLLLAVLFVLNVFSSSFTSVYADENNYGQDVDSDSSGYFTTEDNSLENRDLNNINSLEGEDSEESVDVSTENIMDSKEDSNSQDSVLGVAEEEANVDEEENKEDVNNEKVTKLSEVIDDKEVSVYSENGLPKNAKLIVAKIPTKTAYEIISAEKTDDKNRSVLFAYDIKIVVDGEKYDLDNNESVSIKINNINNIIKDKDFEILHVKKDLVDNTGRIIKNDLENIVTDVKKGNVSTENVSVTTDGSSANFDLESFSVVIGSQDGAGLNTTLSYRENNTDVTQDLSADENKNITLKNMTPMSLRINAVFPAGSEKRIDIRLNNGISYHISERTNTWDAINKLEPWYARSVQEMIIPYDQVNLDDKPTAYNYEINGNKRRVDIINGVLTFKFVDDTESVDFTLPISTLPTSIDGYNIDAEDIQNAITIKQSYKTTDDTSVENVNTLDNVHIEDVPTMDSIGVSDYTRIKNENDNITVKAGGDTGAYVQWYAGNTTNRAGVFSDYYLRILVPEGVTFKEFYNKQIWYVGEGIDTPELQTDGTYVNSKGETVNIESGYDLYTFRSKGRVMMPFKNSHSKYRFDPIWNIPSDAAEGTTYELKMVDVGAKYHKFGEEESYEPVDDALLENAKVTYEVRKPVERVYVQAIYDDKNKPIEGTMKHGPYYLGNPGFEHTQEQILGAFRLGNRGLADSVNKKITISYDINNSGDIGVTDQILPGNYFGENHEKNTKITGVRYKLWNSKTGEVTEYRNYDGDIKNLLYGHNSYSFNSYGYNLTLSQIPHGPDEYFKEIEYQVDTIPNQTIFGNENYVYEKDFAFSGRILTNEAVSRDSDTIVSSIHVEDAEGGNNSITGYSNTGLTGSIRIEGLHGDWAQGTERMTIGETKRISSHLYGAHSRGRAVVVNKAWIVSPNGTEIKNLTITDRDLFDKISVGEGVKRNGWYKKDVTADVEKKEVTDETILNKLRSSREDYKNARIWELDFTKINDKAKFFDARVFGPTVSTVNRAVGIEPASFSGYWFMVGGLDFEYDQEILETDVTNNTTAPLLWADIESITSETKENGDEVQVEKIGFNEDIYGLTGDANRTLFTNASYRVYPTQNITIGSGLKDEDGTIYKTFDQVNDDYSTVVGIDNEGVVSANKIVDYKVSMKNLTGDSIKKLDIFFPIAKKGENWGTELNPKGEFKFDMNLLGPIDSSLPEGFTVQYASVTPNSNHLEWSKYDWKTKEDLGTDPENYKDINLVRIVSNKVLENGFAESFHFNMNASQENAKPGDLVLWKSAFRTESLDGSTINWGYGQPVAAGITEGHIAGNAWFDKNKDGFISDDESKIAGTKIQLYSVDQNGEPLNLLDEQVTDSNGNYAFNGLWADKQYYLKVVEAPEEYDGYTKVPESGDLTKANLFNGEGTAVVNVTNKSIVNLGLSKPSHSVTYSYSGNVPDGAPAVPGPSTVYVGETVNVATKPSLPGYTFNGWTVNSPSGIDASTGSFNMPTGNVELVGTWSRNPLSNYEIKKVYESAPGVYEEIDGYVDTTSRTGNIGDTVEATVDDKNSGREGYEYYDGFGRNVTSMVITEDGSTQLVLFFKKIAPKRSITISKKWMRESDNTEIDASSINKDVKVALYKDDVATGQVVTLNSANNWTATIADLDVAETAFASDEFVYTIKELDDDNNPLEDGALYQIGDSWYRSNVDNNNYVVTNTLYDARHSVAYRYDGDVPENAPALPEEKNYSIKDTVTIAENPEMEDYVFSGWRISTPSDLQKNSDGNTFTMPYGEVTLVGSWTRKGNIKYTVEKVYESAPGVFDTTDVETSDRTGESGTTAYVNDDDKSTSREGYKFDESNTNNVLSGKIKSDGSLVLKVYFKKPVPKVSIDVSKVWLDENSNLAYPADVNGYTVVAELWRRDTSVPNSTPEKVAEKLLTGIGQNSWTARFENLDSAKDAFTNDKYEYTVREGRVDEFGKISFGEDTYTASVSGNPTDGFIITNTKDKTTNDGGTNTEEERISINVEKRWVGEAKDTVVLRLFADGIEKDAVTISANEDWRHTFTDLKKYSNQVFGIEVKYTIVEDEVSGYTSVITGNTEDGFVVTNTKNKTTVDQSTNTDNKTTVDQSTNTDNKTTVDQSTNTDSKTTVDQSTNTDNKTTVDQSTNTDSKTTVDQSTNTDNKTTTTKNEGVVKNETLDKSSNTESKTTSNLKNSQANKSVDKITSGQGKPASNGGKSTLPSTGDNSSMFIGLLSIVVSAAVIIAGIRKNKKAQ